ncbi:NAD(P)/FAD-dependent oxidoreductase [Hydrogenophaga sp. SNF1]|uniref:flavin-containing monooxygenase n=1 Tax=Hydrogenophaga sp. SNF1 TaxID=3098762 RepID=UPI002ACBDD40|nr:NAD(P)/FAD-dependent oxidoreductase [Hydrogenophaga sp. SNF1]WQB82870.1 NAD(P)/FAD-dependent oxidoreductase [Hydrogenophaga sp. SNF1]
MTESAAPRDRHTVLIVGAGPAGLAVAGGLRLLGRDATVIDEAAQLGSSWREHYERLHLHTVKSHSALPGLPFPDGAPRYVPRQGVVDYLEAYARHHRIEPLGGQTVVRITAGADPGARWRVHTAGGRVLEAAQLVLATGANREPRMPVLPGQDAFTGRVLHSHDYRNAQPFKDQCVLVVGMGNTGAEIALDLAEQGVAVALSVRSPVNIVKRDVLGRPTQLSSIALARLPEPIGDACATLLRRLTVGDLSRWGLRTPAASPLRQLRREGKTPVIDVGTLARIRRGEITVYPGIATLMRGGVRFTDGRGQGFDSIVLATGYQPLVQGLFPNHPLPLDERGLPTVLHGEGALAGLHFVGYDIRQPGGLLRTIAMQAERVAGRIAASMAPASGTAGRVTQSG